MKKHLAKLFVILSLSFILAGCWDQKEIDRKAYVIAVGLDLAEDNKVKVTYLIENPTLSTQAGQTDEPPRKIISFVANDFIASKDTADTIVAHTVSYDMLKYMFFSEEFAQDENFFRWLYDAAKDPEIRRNLNLIIVKEDALTYLENNRPVFEARPHRYYNLMMERGKENGMIPGHSELLYYYRITESDADLFLASYSTTTEQNGQSQHQTDDQFIAGELQFEGNINRTQFAGAAVFKNGRMIGKLTAEETRLAILLNNTLNAENMLTNFPDPFNKTYQIAARIISEKNTKTTIDFDNNTIDVTVPLVLDILVNHSMADYWDHKEKRMHLKKYLEEKIAHQMELLVKKTQEKFKGQPFGWSLVARRHFTTIDDYKSFKWDEKYPDMDVQLTVNIEFGEFGRQAVLPSVEEVRD